MIDLSLAFNSVGPIPALMLYKCDSAARDDVDVYISGSTAKHYYVGYSYIVDVEHKYATYPEMVRWCEQHCTSKWRSDILRTVKLPSGDYIFNELSGYDYVMFAFKNDTDCLWFTLTWV